MLVLRRKVGQRIRISEEIVFEVQAIEGNRVKIGVSAPPELHILREELVQHPVSNASALQENTERIREIVEHEWVDLSHLAHLAEQHDGFVAAKLAVYQRTYHLDDPELARLLGCTAEALVHLKLCRLPRAGHGEDIEHLAAFVRVNTAHLAHILTGEAPEP